MDNQLKPWFEIVGASVEFNPGDRPCYVNVGANQEVTIDKLCGPLVATCVRVRLEYKGEIADWVIESEKIETAPTGSRSEDRISWVERARWRCEEGLK